jgi:toxin ParE1/3/4
MRPQAQADLLEIWLHIAKDSASAANKVGDALDHAIRELREMPGKGHTRADVRDPDYRFWSVYAYVIAYRYDDASLTVVRVVHGRRNFRKLFKR